MELAAAVEAAKKKGLSLPKVDKPFVEPPADNSKNWLNHPELRCKLGMSAARVWEGTATNIARCYIVQAAVMAPLALMALSILVLHAETKFDCVSYQIESGNAFRTYALLSGASLVRALACVSLLRDGYDACDALHRMIWHIFFEMDGAKPGISKGRAVLIVFSVTLRFAEEIFKEDPVALSLRRQKLLLSFWRGGYPSQKFQRPASTRSVRWRGKYDQDLSITQALQELEDFWNSMEKETSKEAVISIFGDSFNLHQHGAVPMLILSLCGWCPRTGDPVIVGTVCPVSSAEINLHGTARLVVSPAQRFFTYCRLIHCGQSGQKPEAIGETQYLLDLAGRIPYMCMDKLFGLNGHSNVNLGSTVCMVPLLDASAERDFLMCARVGVFGTLPLLNDDVFRAIYELLKGAPFITGDHGIIEKLFGPEQKWVPGPGW